MKCLTKKDLLLLAIKLIKKITDLRNAKEYDQSFKRKKNTRSVKKHRQFTHQPKYFESRNIVDIKSFITEHRKTSHKLSQTIIQTIKVGSNSPLYSD